MAPPAPPARPRATGREGPGKQFSLSRRVRGPAETENPTLVMIGDDEGHGASSAAMHMDFAKILARDIAGAKPVVFTGQGHFYPFCEPEKFNRVMRDFLAGR